MKIFKARTMQQLLLRPASLINKDDSLPMKETLFPQFALGPKLCDNTESDF